jgi:hypothetical protein
VSKILQPALGAHSFEKVMLLGEGVDLLLQDLPLQLLPTKLDHGQQESSIGGDVISLGTQILADYTSAPDGHFSSVSP